MISIEKMKQKDSTWQQGLVSSNSDPINTEMLSHGLVDIL